MQGVPLGFINTHQVLSHWEVILEKLENSPVYPLYCLDSFTSGIILFIILNRTAFSLLFPFICLTAPSLHLDLSLFLLFHFFLILHFSLPPFLLLSFPLSFLSKNNILRSLCFSYLKKILPLLNLRMNSRIGINKGLIGRVDNINKKLKARFAKGKHKVITLR